MNPTQAKFMNLGRPVGTTGTAQPVNSSAPPPPPRGTNTAAYAAVNTNTVPGQHVTPSGNSSSLHRGMTFKKRIKIEKVARLVATGLYTDEMIATHIGCTKQYVSQLKTTREFQQATIACLSGIISVENEKALETLEARRADLDSMVPMALMQLRNLALSKNPTIALAATKEILDREGNLSKVSRTSVELKAPEDMAQATNTGNAILNILRGVSLNIPQAQPGTIEADPTNGIAPGFTLSASEAKTQVRTMGDTLTEETLSTIDSSTFTVQ